MITIVTPSYNQMDCLKRCCSSVADQPGGHEHLIVDGGSTDGTVEWLEQQEGVRWISESDCGMYDAINKGCAMAKGGIVAYLNCDEQYLPGTLSLVAAMFDVHSNVDLLYGDMLVVRGDGTLLAFRKSSPLRWPYIAASHLYVPSCALFWRRRVLDAGLKFDTRWRIQGDADFVLRTLRAGFHSLHLPHYLAAFTWANANLGNTPAARTEMLAARREAPWWIRWFRIGWDGARRVEKILSGAHRQKFPMDYQIFTQESLSQRARFTTAHGTFRWPSPVFGGV